MLTLQDAWEARQRLRPVLPETPLLFSQPLTNIAGHPVYLKLEQMHVTGSFKLRGATNMIRSLTPEQRAQGVVTFSTGNHGFAVATAAALLGIRSVVCVSENVPANKVEALKASGAELHVEGSGQDEAGEVSARLVEEEGLTLIPPFDHPSVIAGQATMGLEIIEHLPTVKHVLTGLSGGGLLSGLGLALKEQIPDLELIGLSLREGAAMDESLNIGKPTIVPEAPTLADSLLGGIGLENQYTFSMVQRYADQRLRLHENTIARGMAFLYDKHKMVVEGAAAVGTGALLDGLVTVNGPAVLIVSGSSVDVQTHREAVVPYI